MSKAKKIINAVDALKRRAKALKIELFALFLASKDPRVPWHAKAVILFTLAYALSPIDLIPDFIPILGYLDDLIIVPIGITISIRLIPSHVLAECRSQAELISKQSNPKERLRRLPWRWLGLIFVFAIWISFSWLLIRTCWPNIMPR